MSSTTALLFLVGLVIVAALIAVGVRDTGTPLRRATPGGPAPAAPHAPEGVRNDLPPGDLRGMQQVITIHGYSCSQIQRGIFWGPGPSGDEFQVTCTSGDFQVVLRPDKTFLVRPWATRMR
jgi:hypothetical protein